MGVAIKSKIHLTQENELYEVRGIFTRIDLVLKDELNRIEEKNQFLSVQYAFQIFIR